jgi:hypothetical protein
MDFNATKLRASPPGVPRKLENRRSRDESKVVSRAKPPQKTTIHRPDIENPVTRRTPMRNRSSGLWEQLPPGKRNQPTLANRQFSTDPVQTDGDLRIPSIFPSLPTRSPSIEPDSPPPTLREVKVSEKQRPDRNKRKRSMSGRARSAYRSAKDFANGITPAMRRDLDFYENAIKTGQMYGECNAPDEDKCLMAKIRLFIEFKVLKKNTKLKTNALPLDLETLYIESWVVDNVTADGVNWNESNIPSSGLMADKVSADMGTVLSVFGDVIGLVDTFAQGKEALAAFGNDQIEAATKIVQLFNLADKAFRLPASEVTPEVALAWIKLKEAISKHPEFSTIQKAESYIEVSDTTRNAALQPAGIASDVPAFVTTLGGHVPLEVTNNIAQTVPGLDIAAALTHLFTGGARKIKTAEIAKAIKIIKKDFEDACDRAKKEGMLPPQKIDELSQTFYKHLSLLNKLNKMASYRSNVQLVKGSLGILLGIGAVVAVAHAIPGANVVLGPLSAVAAVSYLSVTASYFTEASKAGRNFKRDWDNVESLLWTYGSEEDLQLLREQRPEQTYEFNTTIGPVDKEHEKDFSKKLEDRRSFSLTDTINLDILQISKWLAEGALEGDACKLLLASFGFSEFEMTMLDKACVCYHPTKRREVIAAQIAAKLGLPAPQKKFRPMNIILSFAKGLENRNLADDNVKMDIWTKLADRNVLPELKKAVEAFDKLIERDLSIEMERLHLIYKGNPTKFTTINSKINEKDWATIREILCLPKNSKIIDILKVWDDVKNAYATCKDFLDNQFKKFEEKLYSEISMYVGENPREHVGTPFEEFQKAMKVTSEENSAFAKVAKAYWLEKKLSSPSAKLEFSRINNSMGNIELARSFAKKWIAYCALHPEIRDFDPDHRGIDYFSIQFGSGAGKFGEKNIHDVRIVSDDIWKNFSIFDKNPFSIFKQHDVNLSCGRTDIFPDLELHGADKIFSQPYKDINSTKLRKKEIINLGGFLNGEFSRQQEIEKRRGKKITFQTFMTHIIDTYSEKSNYSIDMIDTVVRIFLIKNKEEFGFSDEQENFWLDSLHIAKFLNEAFTEQQNWEEARHIKYKDDLTPLKNFMDPAISAIVDRFKKEGYSIDVVHESLKAFLKSREDDFYFDDNQGQKWLNKLGQEWESATVNIEA